MEHHPGCKDPSKTTILHLSATERVKQCDSCGAFENLANTFSVADFSELEKRVCSHAEFNEQYLITPAPIDPRCARQGGHDWDFDGDKSFCKTCKTPRYTPTGRTPRPFNPEPHHLPRSRPALWVLVCDGRRPPRWANHLEISLIYASFLQIVIDVSDEHAPYCPIKWTPPFDIHAFDRARGNNG